MFERSNSQFTACGLIRINTAKHREWVTEMTSTKPEDEDEDLKSAEKLIRLLANDVGYDITLFFDTLSSQTLILRESLTCFHFSSQILPRSLKKTI